MTLLPTGTTRLKRLQPTADNRGSCLEASQRYPPAQTQPAAEKLLHALDYVMHGRYSPHRIVSVERSVPKSSSTDCLPDDSDSSAYGGQAWGLKGGCYGRTQRQSGTGTGRCFPDDGRGRELSFRFAAAVKAPRVVP